MTIILYQPSAFDRHQRKGEIIGRLVIEYGELEFDLCRLAGAIIGDMDTALKAIFRSRGETQRINVGDALIRGKLAVGKARTIYEGTIARLRDCLTIRNRYAHTIWTDGVDGTLTYLDIEEAAKSNCVITSIDTTYSYVVSDELLNAQVRLFLEVGQNLKYLSWEHSNTPGRPIVSGFHYVGDIKGPPKPETLAAYMDR